MIIVVQQSNDLMSGSNPLTVLSSYHRNVEYEFREESGPPHNKKFVCACILLGQEFTGVAKNKKDAKRAAAAEALRRLYNLNLQLGKTESGELKACWYSSRHCLFVQLNR